MNKKGGNQFYQLRNSVDKHNIYTNKRLNDGYQDIKCFSSPRPLSANQPYRQVGRVAYKHLRSNERSQKSPKPMKIGKVHPPNEQNINLYFSKEDYEHKLKSPEKLRKINSKSSQKNIYVSKNINTSYGKGHFTANYKNLFINYPYQGEQKKKQTTPKKDLYTNYKKKQVFKPTGNSNKIFTQQNQMYQNKINDPYKPKDQQNMFRAKSAENKFLNRFKWKPTTQFIKKMQY